MHRFLIIILLLCAQSVTAQYNIADQYWKKNRSMPYEKVIDFFQENADKHDDIHIYNKGSTDAGQPLHIVLINGDSTRLKDKNTLKILINNGIHPGEPCGVDASIQWLYDYAQGKKSLPDNIVLAIIPMYNIGGALRRGCCTRANQNGPEMYGFRGNAKNLDLNRDFIKMDSDNAFAFAEVFHFVDPHLIMDTHTSNGADYPYTMTYLPQQKDVLNPKLLPLRKQMKEFLYKAMEKQDQPMIPYVYSVDQTPYSGLKSYYDKPRYTTGYAGLFNCLGFTSEAHMLKTFPQRVKATYQLIQHFLTFAENNATTIIKARKAANKRDMRKKNWAFDFQIDTTQSEPLPFSGYAVERFTSAITGKQTYRYDSTSGVDTIIPHYTTYHPKDTLRAPAYFVLPQARGEIIERLLVNNVQMIRIQSDTSMLVNRLSTIPNPATTKLYEGHFYHKDVEVIQKKNTRKKYFHAGDWLIPVQQQHKRFLMHTLMPQMVDSYWRWNFFDATLQRKEYFSPYVFEATAQKLLDNNPKLAEDWEAYKKRIDLETTSQWEMLYFLYKKSPYDEGTAYEYPIYLIK